MRIGLTMRVSFLPERGETRDAIDQAWLPILQGLGLEPILISNATKNLEQYVRELQIQGFLLSGGNDLASLEGGVDVSEQRDALEFELLKIAQNRTYPVFGVCRGMQIMNSFLGGSLSRVSGHAGTSHEVSFQDDSDNASSSMPVNSFNNWGIRPRDLATSARPIAVAQDQTIEALFVDDLNWGAVMWHPEREKVISESDKELISSVFFGKKESP
jgi:putative glutamine amidotransferase